MKKLVILSVMILMCVSLTVTSFAASVNYEESFESYTAEYELSNTANPDSWSGWAVKRPTAGGTFVRAEGGNKYAHVTSYFEAIYNTTLAGPYVYEVDVFNANKNNVSAFFVRASRELFDVQYGKATGFEFDGDTAFGTSTVGGSGFYILPNNGKTLTINIKTYDESKAYKIGNVRYSVDVTADFSTGFQTLKFEDDGQNVKIYAEDELAFTVELSNQGKYTLGEETYYKKAVVKNKAGEVLGTVENARISVSSTIIIGSRSADFKFDNVKITAEQEPSPATNDTAVIFAFAACSVMATAVIKKRRVD